MTYDELREGDSPMGVDRVGRHLVVLDVLGIANVPAQFEACHHPYAITQREVRIGRKHFYGVLK